MENTVRRYTTEAAPTLGEFHRSGAIYRCIVGPAGSGKSSAASQEIGYYLPQFFYKQYKIKETKWGVVRNTYPRLMDSVVPTLKYWFPWAKQNKQEKTFNFSYQNGVKVEIQYRSCDDPRDMEKFNGWEVTGVWVDESIQVSEDIKEIIKSRIGRYPSMRGGVPAKFYIETTNPPTTRHPLYSQFNWNIPPPGPTPQGEPLVGHMGFWQKPGENERNLNKGYYADMRDAFRDSPDMIARYIEGRPGIIVIGKPVYNNFKSGYHVSRTRLVWSKGTLYRGWDSSGNIPACVVCQLPSAQKIQVIKEFVSDREAIVDFTKRVQRECEIRYPGATYVDYADPAGAATYSTRSGGFTSNHQLMKEVGVEVIPSEQNPAARQGAVDDALRSIDGLLVDGVECRTLVDGFEGGYCHEKSNIVGEFKESPLKNIYSHVHDALQYVVVRMSRSVREERIDERIQEIMRKYKNHGGLESVQTGWMGN